MHTIMQTVTIPADRRVLLDCAVPDDIPTGVAEVSVTFQPVDVSVSPKKSFMDFYGALKNSPALAGDSVAIQRALRDEW